MSEQTIEKADDHNLCETDELGECPLYLCRLERRQQQKRQRCYHGPLYFFLSTVKICSFNQTSFRFRTLFHTRRFLRPNPPSDSFSHETFAFVILVISPDQRKLLHQGFDASFRQSKGRHPKVDQSINYRRDQLQPSRERETLNCPAIESCRDLIRQRRII